MSGPSFAASASVRWRTAASDCPNWTGTSCPSGGCRSWTLNLRTRSWTTSGSASFASGMQGESNFLRVKLYLIQILIECFKRFEYENSERRKGQKRRHWWSGQDVDPHGLELFYLGKIRLFIKIFLCHTQGRNYDIMIFHHLLIFFIYWVLNVRHN